MCGAALLLASDVQTQGNCMQHQVLAIATQARVKIHSTQSSPPSHTGQTHVHGHVRMTLPASRHEQTLTTEVGGAWLSPHHTKVSGTQTKPLTHRQVPDYVSTLPGNTLETVGARCTQVTRQHEPLPADASTGSPYTPALPLPASWPKGRHHYVLAGPGRLTAYQQSTQGPCRGKWTGQTVTTVNTTLAVNTR